MEARSKERLTGALILVAILVLLVPEMLSGRGSKPQAAAPAEVTKPAVTYTLPTTTDDRAPPADQSVLTARPPDVTQPVLPAPAAAPPPPPVEAPPPQPAQAAAPEPQPVPVPGKRPEKPKPEAKPETKPVVDAKAKTDAKAKVEVKAKPDTKPKDDAKAKPADKGWWVQAGSFAQRDNAQRLARDLAAKGFAAQVRDAGKSQFKVRVGPVKDRKAAQALQAKLVAAGYRGTVQAP